MVVPIDRGPPAPSREAGFSLLELMVVVAILAVLAISATLAVGRNAPERPRDLATIEALFADLRQLAVQGQRPLGLDLSGSGWRRVEYDPATGTWARDRAEIRWSGPVLVRLAPGTGAAAALSAPGATPPTVIFLPDGRLTPVELRIGLASAMQTCTTDGVLPLACRGRG